MKLRKYYKAYSHSKYWVCPAVSVNNSACLFPWFVQTSREESADLKFLLILNVRGNNNLNPLSLQLDTAELDQADLDILRRDEIVVLHPETIAHVV